jgi:hypothetical protein
MEQKITQKIQDFNTWLENLLNGADISIIFNKDEFNHKCMIEIEKVLEVVKKKFNNIFKIKGEN